MFSALTIGGEEKVSSVLLRQPSDLIDLLLNLQTFKVVEFGLMALKGAVHIVLSLGKWLRLALWKKTKKQREYAKLMSRPDFILENVTIWQVERKRVYLLLLSKNPLYLLEALMCAPTSGSL